MTDALPSQWIPYFGKAPATLFLHKSNVRQQNAADNNNFAATLEQVRKAQMAVDVTSSARPG
jgi:hypothetical protein